MLIGNVECRKMWSGSLFICIGSVDHRNIGIAKGCNALPTSSGQYCTCKRVNGLVLTVQYKHH